MIHKNNLQCFLYLQEIAFLVPTGPIKDILLNFNPKAWFPLKGNTTTTTQKQSDYKVEQSSFTLVALF